LKTLLSDWKTSLALAGAVLTLLLLLAYSLYRPAVDPDEAERRRRLHLNQIGRIAEGSVIELVEHPAETGKPARSVFGSRARPLVASRSRHLVSYSYSICGVIYQTAQDITGLESQVRLERLVAGQPASVKYDPSNPVDSILVADDWSGLR
jgi:hypothetical protein